jgi:Ca2+-binding EF-hand superfamily protein
MKKTSNNLIMAAGLILVLILAVVTVSAQVNRPERPSRAERPTVVAPDQVDPNVNPTTPTQEGPGANRPFPRREGGPQPFLRGADKDGDGLISREEFDQAVEAMFANLDKNQDGVIDREEQAAAPRPERRPEPGQGDPGIMAERVKTMFNKMDANQDGKLTSDEWRGNQERFTQMDTDKDGALTMEEFQAMEGAMRDRIQQGLQDRGAGGETGQPGVDGQRQRLNQGGQKGQRLQRGGQDDAQPRQ